MLLELVVENYAVVDRLRIRFHAGLNLLTGETGSGKSIVVDALGLLFGGRASAEAVRSGESRAHVAGIFDVRGNSGVQALLEPTGFEAEDGELLIEREILSSGKSRAFIGSRPAAVSLLRGLAPLLGDIHGQHDQQQLFSPDAQRDMLDSFAGVQDLTAQTASLFREARRVQGEIAELERSEQEKLRLLDMWEFQRKEIEAADLKAGEDSALEAERRVLQNLGKLQESSSAAYEALYDSPSSAVSQARIAFKKIEELARIDASVEPVRESLRAADLALQEAAYGLRDYASRLESDPGRLDEVESRLALLDRMKRKYGGTLDEVLAFLETARAQIDAAENAGERLDALKKDEARLSTEFAAVAAKLHGKREAAAGKLQAEVEKELAGLAMERTVFRIAVTPAGWSAAGADRVEFLVSPNVGEEPKALDKIASGGEISRIALALKTCIAVRPAAIVRTLVFDEVDTGIGGSAAEGVGRRLKKLSAADQVLCVTHLAQIASFADHHYRVEKAEMGGRTVATVDELEADARTREIGRMLSGQRLTPEALKHAEQLIRMSAAL